MSGPCRAHASRSCVDLVSQDEDAGLLDCGLEPDLTDPLPHIFESRPLLIVEDDYEAACALEITPGEAIIAVETCRVKDL